MKKIKNIGITILYYKINNKILNKFFFKYINNIFIGACLTCFACAPILLKNTIKFLKFGSPCH